MRLGSAYVDAADIELGHVPLHGLTHSCWTAPSKMSGVVGVDMTVRIAQPSISSSMLGVKPFCVCVTVHGADRGPGLWVGEVRGFTREEGG